MTAREIDSLIARLDRAATALRARSRHWDRTADERALVALAGEAREARGLGHDAQRRETGLAESVDRDDLRDARERLHYACSRAVHQLAAEGYYRDDGPREDVTAILSRRARLAARWRDEQQSLRERLARAGQ